MSTSTVSLPANQGPTTRRRAVEKNLTADAAGDNQTDKIIAGDTTAEILRDARKPASQTPTRKSAKKSTKPLWLTVVSILTKNLALLIVLLGFVQMMRYTVLWSGGSGEDYSVISGDFEGKLFEVEKFVKRTVKAMQVQVDAVDRKLEEGMGSVRREFEEKIERKGDEIELKVRALDVRSDVFDKFMEVFKGKSLLSKEEFGEFFEEFKKARKYDGGTDVSLDEVREYARRVVKEEIDRHEADGLGMVDYALASGGGRVVRHSKVFGGGMRGTGIFGDQVSPEAEKMIRPSFGEPGQCFPLKGGSGFVEIRLRTAIVPEAVTLEHIAKSVAYDRSSAPKHCRISGWLQGQESSDSGSGAKKMFLLTEFTYDLEKSNVQTFKVESAATPGLVDTIRLDITSNHGSASHTCIYRLRVHGLELKSSVPAL